jgi:hypothetical protein
LDGGDYALALACFHEQDWTGAQEHLEASPATARDPLAQALLARVKANLKTGIGQEVDPLPVLNPEELRRPAARSIREPKLSGEAFPPERKRDRLGRLLHRAYSRVSGFFANASVLVAWIFRDRKALYDFESWDKRRPLRGLLEIGGRRHDLIGKRLHAEHPGELVGAQPPGQCRPPWTERFRTATGAWTTDDPMEGAAGTEIQRSGSPLSKRRDWHAEAGFPSPREVSRWLLAPLAKRARQEAPFLNLLTIAWIQAQLHDWVSHPPARGAEMHKVELAPDDPLRSRYGIDALHVPRSAVNPCSDAKPLTYLSEVTHWWDASHLYGSDQETLDRLRACSDGKLRIDGELLPVHPKTGIEDTGFARNWWIGLDLIHTLFVQHHNYICDRLIAGEPQRKWSSDELFHTARLINAAIMAKIHSVEWTPAVLPNAKTTIGMSTNWWGMLQTLFRRVRRRKTLCWWEPRHPVLGGIVGGACDNHGKPYAMTEEFTEVYRLHAGIPDEVRLKPLGAAPPPPPVPTEETRGTAAHGMVDKHGMAMLLNSFGHQHMPALVNNNYPAFMCDMSVHGQPVIDIGTIDIFRARERGVPPYNAFRCMLGLNPISRFEDLGCSAETVEVLERLYGPGPQGVEKLDLLAGTSCELWRPENFGFGETMFTLFIQMASRRLEADPFYTEKFNERYYTKTGMALIEGATFKGVLLQHYPQLEEAGLRNVENAFEPWGTTAREHPEEHPLAAIVEY